MQWLATKPEPPVTRTSSPLMSRRLLVGSISRSSVVASPHLPTSGARAVRPPRNARIVVLKSGPRSSVMKIGELANQTGLAASAIRFYERSGVLPAPDRGVNGYRSYGESDVQRLHMIRIAQ